MPMASFDPAKSPSRGLLAGHLTLTIKAKAMPSLSAGLQLALGEYLRLRKPKDSHPLCFTNLFRLHFSGEFVSISRTMPGNNSQMKLNLLNSSNQLQAISNLSRGRSTLVICILLFMCINHENVNVTLAPRPHRVLTTID